MSTTSATPDRALSSAAPEAGRRARPLWLLATPAVFLLLWSAGYPIAKIGLRYSDPLTLLALRYASALVLLAPSVVVYWPPFPRNARAWMQVLIVGFLIQAAYFGLAYTSFKFGASAGAVALIVSMQPIVVGLLAPLVISERLNIWRWLGLVLGLAGAGLVIVARSKVEVESVWGVGFAVAALLAISAATLCEKGFGERINPLTSSFVQYAVGLVCILPFAWWLEPMHVNPTPELVLVLAYLVIGNSIIAISLLLAMIRAGEASRVSALLFLVPPMAALIAWGMIGEAMPPLAWVGMAVATLGVLLATRRA